MPRNLTAEEETQVAVFVNKWEEIARRVGPADRPETKAAISKQYREAGMKEPTHWVWAPNPKMASFCAYLIHYHWGQLKRLEIIGDDDNASGCRKALAILREQLDPDDHGDAVQVTPDVESIVEEFSGACGGNLSAVWLGLCDFFREACDLKEQTEQIAGAIEAAKHCGMWWPFEDAVVVSDRPEGAKYIARAARGASDHSSMPFVDIRQLVDNLS